jgi:hypothetical protein
VGNPCDEFVAHFTTANTAAPTVDGAKTRGIISVVRAGVGLFDITLPWGLRHCDVQITPFAYPAGAIVNAWRASHTEGTRVVRVTVVVISTGSAGDTTGLELAVRIRGRSKA